MTPVDEGALFVFSDPEDKALRFWDDGAPDNDAVDLFNYHLVRTVPRPHDCECAVCRWPKGHVWQRCWNQMEFDFWGR